MDQTILNTSAVQTSCSDFLFRLPLISQDFLKSTCFVQLMRTVSNCRKLCEKIFTRPYSLVSYFLQSGDIPQLQIVRGISGGFPGILKQSVYLRIFRGLGDQRVWKVGQGKPTTHKPQQIEWREQWQKTPN